MITSAFTPMWADAPPPQLNGSWLVDIRTICAVGGVVLSGTWWIGRWMQKVDSRCTALETAAAVREAQLNSIENTLNLFAGNYAKDQRSDRKAGI